MPYFSYQCVVTNVSDGKIFFDPAIGCDQGGPTPYTPGKAWDWSVILPSVSYSCDFAPFDICGLGLLRMSKKNVILRWRCVL